MRMQHGRENSIIERTIVNFSDGLKNMKLILREPLVSCGFSEHFQYVVRSVRTQLKSYI